MTMFQITKVLDIMSNPSTPSGGVREALRYNLRVAEEHHNAQQTTTAKIMKPRGKSCSDGSDDNFLSCESDDNVMTPRSTKPDHVKLSTPKSSGKKKRRAPQPPKVQYYCYYHSILYHLYSIDQNTV